MGEVKSVCDDNFNEFSGQVACRELYGENSTVVEINSA
jgi:hypothetical protein